MSDFISLFNQAISYHRVGNIREAIKLYLRLLPMQRENDELLFVIGTAYCQMGKLEEGLNYLRKSSRVNSKNFHTFSNMGKLLTDLRRFDEAIINYNKALAINPIFPEALLGRGNALLEIGELQAALDDYEKCIDLVPNFSIAYCNKGKVLFELGRLEEALATNGHAISLQPEFSEAYCNQGNVLRKLGRYEDAIGAYEKAIKINKEVEGAYSNLGKVLCEIGRQDEGEARFNEALRINPNNIEARWLRMISELPIIPIADEAQKRHREKFGQELVEIGSLLTKTRLVNAYKAVGSAQPFYLAYQENNNKHLLSRYGSLCCQLMTTWQKDQKMLSHKQLHKKPIKVGFVSNHICGHSVWNALTRGWVQNIDRGRFELHFFYTGEVVDDQTVYAESIAANFLKVEDNLYTTVSQIAVAELDILIYPEIGMDPMALKLASMRLAPVQAASWGHPETTGLPTIDYYLSAELIEPPDSEEFYTEHLIKLPNLGCCYQETGISIGAVDLLGMGISTDMPLFVCPGTPFKYQPRFDYVYVEIAKKLGVCQFVFFTYEIEQLTDIFKKRLANEFLKHGLRSSDYCIYVPWQTKESFYGLLSRADVYLDTIGFSGFNTAMQAIECNLPIVTREGRFMRGRLASGILKRIGLEELVAEDDKQYAELAVKLVRDREYRQAIKKRIETGRYILYNDLQPIKYLENFFEEALEKLV